ncbi:hypothetical protein APB26_31860 [Pseudomonas aeruginosa]|uniref:hypothetical protein n=1 Tax=Pseudomonas aeruginosa TaxID=287 RepID=UPI00071B8D37|nr:hypothetical protein [Pseudomonas aeruginosa]KSQ21585.1 hypothetical protein APB26_31860 [Pseudomonas aeruginosa]RPV61254.1 hypothetical protein IPC838_18190 [Pseudomonas aeruginosa]
MSYFNDESAEPALPVKVGVGHLPTRMTVAQARLWAKQQHATQGGSEPALEIKSPLGFGYLHIEITFH